MKKYYRTKNSAEAQGGIKNLTPVKIVKLIASVILVALTIVFTVMAVKGTLTVPEKFSLVSKSETFSRVDEISEDDFEEAKIVSVGYLALNYDCTCYVDYTLEEYEEGIAENFEGFVYRNENSQYFGFDHEATEKELASAQRSLNADEQNGNYGAAMALFFVAVSVVLMLLWHDFFSAYEQIWFISIIALAAVFSIVFPEEEVNGINGLIIMLLYLLDTFLNILCELLISKQSKWNFIVSVFVELTEIAICLVLSYRFATLASTLFFWLPCDIISFINWHKHPDKVEEELTEVRTLKGWQEVLIVAGIVVWTVVVGWFLSGLEFTTTLFNGNETLATVVCYLDACASAVGICNGVFILVRLREQWIAWYVEAALETVINILSGQYVLLVLKLGYFTNTTYGYIRWTKYIKSVDGKKVEDVNKHKKIGAKE